MGCRSSLPLFSTKLGSSRSCSTIKVSVMCYAINKKNLADETVEIEFANIEKANLVPEI